jgi:transcriptional regulator with XRE-family HTH domain
MNLGKVLKDERQRQKLSQQTLADTAGVTKRAIAYWESGKKQMNVESADKVFKALHMSVKIGEQ